MQSKSRSFYPAVNPHFWVRLERRQATQPALTSEKELILPISITVITTALLGRDSWLTPVDSSQVSTRKSASRSPARSGRGKFYYGEEALTRNRAGRSKPLKPVITRPTRQRSLPSMSGTHPESQRPNGQEAEAPDRSPNVGRSFLRTKRDRILDMNSVSARVKRRRRT